MAASNAEKLQTVGLRVFVLIRFALGWRSLQSMFAACNWADTKPRYEVDSEDKVVSLSVICALSRLDAAGRCADIALDAVASVVAAVSCLTT